MVKQRWQQGDLMISESDVGALEDILRPSLMAAWDARMMRTGTRGRGREKED